MRGLYLHNGPLFSQQANVIQVLHMCDALTSLGFDMTLAAPDDGIKSSSDAQDLALREIGRDSRVDYVPFKRLTVAGYLSNLGCRWGAKTLLTKGVDFDFCITRNLLVVDLLLRRNIPTILEFHHEQTHSLGWLDQCYRWKFLPWLRSENLVKVVTISEALAQVWIEAGVPVGKIQVLHDGVAGEDYETVEERAFARNRLGLPEDGHLVVYAGSLYPDREVESVFKLARAYPSAHFLVIGGPKERRLELEREQMSLDLDNVTFKGRVPHQNVREYLFAADVILMLWGVSVPTIKICSPLKVFESMAAGRVIVGHGFPTIREVLTDGQEALLATPGDYQDLERKLGLALGMSYPNSMAERARTLALEKYTWDRRARMLMDSQTVKKIETINISS